MNATNTVNTAKMKIVRFSSNKIYFDPVFCGEFEYDTPKFFKILKIGKSAIRCHGNLPFHGRFFGTRNTNLGIDLPALGFFDQGNPNLSINFIPVFNAKLEFGNG